MQDTLRLDRLAWIVLRLVFACFGDFGPRSAFGIVRSANYHCRIKMLGGPFPLGGPGELSSGKILKI